MTERTGAAVIGSRLQSGHALRALTTQLVKKVHQLHRKKRVLPLQSPEVLENCGVYNSEQYTTCTKGVLS